MTRTHIATRDLTLAYLVSIAVALLVSVASLAGLIDGPRVYAGVDMGLLTLLIGQDALNLLVGLPILLGAMWLARRGALIGLLLWPGALFYVLYDYGYYVLGVPFNALFLVYLALMTLSAYAMIAVVASLDANAVRAELIGAVPSRLVGGVLVGVSLLFTALWTALVVSALISGSEFDLIPRVVTTLDLTIQLPALFVGGILLLRRHSLGYVVAAGLLLQASAYLAGLSAITVLQEVVLAQPFDAIAVVPGCVVGVIGLGLIATFVRTAARDQTVTLRRVSAARH